MKETLKQQDVSPPLIEVKPPPQIDESKQNEIPKSPAKSESKIENFSPLGYTEKSKFEEDFEELEDS